MTTHRTSYAIQYRRADSVEWQDFSGGHRFKSHEKASEILASWKVATDHQWDWRLLEIQTTTVSRPINA